MKRILICTPLKGGLSPTYTRGLISLLFAKMGGQYRFDCAWTSGTSVAMARDELACLFLERGDDEMIFLDKDLGATDPQMMLAMYARLLGHDVDVVAGQYVGHDFNSHFHGAVMDEGELGPNGLMKMAQIPLGFSKIKRGAFLKIKEAHPHRRYAVKQTVDNVPTLNRFEFFPNGVVGPCTAEGKLERLKAIIKPKNTVASFELMDEITSILYDDRYETNYMLGEDFYFCKLAREAGVDLYIDNNMIIPHETSIRLPVTNSQLLAVFSEQWRWADGTKPEEVSATVEALKRLLGPNHV